MCCWSTSLLRRGRILAMTVVPQNALGALRDRRLRELEDEVRGREDSLMSMTSRSRGLLGYKCISLSAGGGTVPSDRMA